MIKKYFFKTPTTIGMQGMGNCKFFPKFCYLSFFFEGYNMSLLNRKDLERSDGEGIILECERDFLRNSLNNIFIPSN